MSGATPRNAPDLVCFFNPTQSADIRYCTNRVVGRIQGCDPPNTGDRPITFGGTHPWFRPTDLGLGYAPLVPESKNLRTKQAPRSRGQKPSGTHDWEAASFLMGWNCPALSDSAARRSPSKTSASLSKNAPATACTNSSRMRN